MATVARLPSSVPGWRAHGWGWESERAFWYTSRLLITLTGLTELINYAQDHQACRGARALPGASDMRPRPGETGHDGHRESEADYRGLGPRFRDCRIWYSAYLHLQS